MAPVCGRWSGLTQARRRFQPWKCGSPEVDLPLKSTGAASGESPIMRPSLEERRYSGGRLWRLGARAKAAGQEALLERPAAPLVPGPPQGLGGILKVFSGHQRKVNQSRFASPLQGINNLEILPEAPPAPLMRFHGQATG